MEGDDWSSHNGGKPPRGSRRGRTLCEQVTACNCMVGRKKTLGNKNLESPRRPLLWLWLCTGEGGGGGTDDVPIQPVPHRCPRCFEGVCLPDPKRECFWTIPSPKGSVRVTYCNLHGGERQDDEAKRSPPAPPGSFWASKKKPHISSRQMFSDAMQCKRTAPSHI
jgi:hypothetical protein